MRCRGECSHSPCHAGETREGREVDCEWEDKGEGGLDEEARGGGGGGGREGVEGEEEEGGRSVPSSL